MLNLIYKQFEKELFIPNLKATSKTEALQKICAHIQKHKKVPQDFYELVLKREIMLQTEYGNRIALPHPFAPVSDETFVSVSVLDEPIYWGMEKVQVIFLVSIAKEKNDRGNLEEFYNDLFKLVFNKNYITNLIKSRSFEDLCKMLNEIKEKGNKNV